MIKGEKCLMVYDLPRDTAPHSFGAHDSSSRKNVDWKELLSR